VKLFVIDPSSTACGYSVLASHRNLIECGRVTPDKAHSPTRRAWEMASELAEIVKDCAPTHILIEMPADQAPRIGAQGQGKYGVACGIIYAIVRTSFSEATIEEIQSDKWPRMWRKSKSDAGVKSRRQAALRSQFPLYDPKRDPGLDIADSIELGQFWFGRQMKPTALIGDQAA
jgi:hypothetical protein